MYVAAVHHFQLSELGWWGRVTSSLHLSGEVMFGKSRSDVQSDRWRSSRRRNSSTVTLFIKRNLLYASHTHTHTHPSKHNLLIIIFCLSRLRGSPWCPYPVTVQGAGHTLDKSQVHHITSCLIWLLAFPLPEYSLYLWVHTQICISSLLNLKRRTVPP